MSETPFGRFCRLLELILSCWMHRLELRSAIGYSWRFVSAFKMRAPTTVNACRIFNDRKQSSAKLWPTWNAIRTDPLPFTSFHRFSRCRDARLLDPSSQSRPTLLLHSFVCIGSTVPGVCYWEEINSPLLASQRRPLTGVSCILARSQFTTGSCLARPQATRLRGR